MNGKGREGDGGMKADKEEGIISVRRIPEAGPPLNPR